MSFLPSDDGENESDQKSDHRTDQVPLAHRRSREDDDAEAVRDARAAPRVGSWWREVRFPTDWRVARFSGARFAGAPLPGRKIGAVAFGLVLLLVAIVAAAAAALRHDMRASRAQVDGSLAVEGISAPVTVTRDAQGVPSIRAANLDDLLFAQGYVTASDRMFQMDALRRHGAGELAEVLGPTLVQHDREQRYLQLRAAADRAVAMLPADQLHQLQAYARGVNAYITTHEGSGLHANTLPVEFHILRYRPAMWTPRDSLLISLVMAQDLATGFTTKLNREALSAHLPASLLPDLYPVGSWRDQPPTQSPTDLTAPSAPIEQIPLDRTQSSCAECERSTGTGMSPRESAASGAGFASGAGGASAQDLLRIGADLRENLCAECVAGSNNWVVAGGHTATGLPLLSNDMHLTLTAPDIWYEASLHAAGDTPLDVEGFTLPGVPFVIVGRNKIVSWGFTNSGADVQDVLVEHLRGKGAGMEFERVDHSWAPVGHHVERIHVRFGRDVMLDVLTTTHAVGSTTISTPIISPLYRSERRALALEWTVYDPSTVTSPFFAVDSAKDAASLVAAFAGFTTVSQNLVYADAQHIGYHLLGRIPIRGPAVQRPRAQQPFVLPDDTPPEDDEDESGDAQTSMAAPVAGGFSPVGYSEVDVGERRSAKPVLLLASATWEPMGRELEMQVRRRSERVYGRTRRRAGVRVKRRRVRIPTQQSSVQQKVQVPAATATTTDYTIGSPISPLPVDALDAGQAWSGYIPYDVLPAVLDPSSGMIATANARIVTDQYPYFIANNWVGAYRVDRIDHLLTEAIASGKKLTPADMLAMQMDVHSEFDLLMAQRLAYALDHSKLTRKSSRLAQAANLLRDWNGDVTANSPAAAIVAAARDQLWPMLLAPQLRSQAVGSQVVGSQVVGPQVGDPQVRGRKTVRLSKDQVVELIDLYTWEEKTSALEQILQHTPARWLPRGFATWNDFLTTAVERSLRFAGAPGDLSKWSYGSIHPIDIPHPVFGSGGIISKLLGVPTGTGFHPDGGDNTTVDATGLHFGPSERFTADLADAEDTHANVTTGESGNFSSPWFLDQFGAWLHGTTFRLGLDHPVVRHTLTLTPQL